MNCEEKSAIGTEPDRRPLFASLYGDAVRLPKSNGACCVPNAFIGESGMIVRVAEIEDLERVVSILERKRQQLQAWEPNFWRKSSSSAAMSQAFLGSVIDDPNSVLLLAEEDDCILGCLHFKPTFVPPVYEPKGTTWMVDDFVAPNDRWMDVGAALLRELRARTVENQEGQLIFPVPVNDEEAGIFFKANGLNPTTTWWTVSSDPLS